MQKDDLEQEVNASSEEILQDEVEATSDGKCSAETDECQKETEQLKDRLLRLQAEFDNFRRRSRSESEQLGTYISAGVIQKFLPALDNFKRSLDADYSGDVEGMKKGMELIYRQMEKAIADAGAEKILALGEQFSPDLHEALMNTQNPDLPDGQIDMVFEDGYKIKDKVIRHSKVRVVNNS